MNEQLTLFGTPADDTSPSLCRFADHSAITAYRYGCRCRRCIGASRAPHPTLCTEPGCTVSRVKGRRYCPDHPTHGPTGKRNPSALLHGICELCNAGYGWYESQVVLLGETSAELARRTCRACRHPYSLTIRRHHLTVDWALRLMAAERCDLCRRPLATDPNGRARCYVDHAHRCCPGLYSCGACVRGVLCARCNQALVAVETTLDVGMDVVRRYLGRDD